MTAGLDACDADAAIPIDVDLQDPPHVIPLLVAKWREGFEVVLAKRADRSQRQLHEAPLRVDVLSRPQFVAAQKIPHDVGDFRLIDRQVIDALRTLPERRRFMKGLFAWVGFRTTTVEYVRDAACRRADQVFRLEALELRARRHHQLFQRAAGNLDLCRRDDLGLLVPLRRC